MNNNRTLADEIITLINNEANNNPAPTKCTIKKVYSDNNHVDAETDIGTLTHVETISSNLQVGNIGIVVYCDGDYDNPIIITK